MFNRTALILCDVQKKVIPKIFNGTQMVRNIGNLIDCYNFNNKKKLVFEPVDKYPIIIGEFLPDKLGKNVFDLKSGPGVKVLTKDTYSMVSPELLDNLYTNSVINVCLTGVQTEWCIYQTAVDLANSGFQVDVIKDACGSTQRQEHLDALDELKTINRVRTPTLHRWIVSRLQGAQDEYNFWYLNLLNNIKKEDLTMEQKIEKENRIEICIKEDW